MAWFLSFFSSVFFHYFNLTKSKQRGVFLSWWDIKRSFLCDKHTAWRVIYECIYVDFLEPVCSTIRSRMRTCKAGSIFCGGLLIYQQIFNLTFLQCLHFLSSPNWIAQETELQMCMKVWWMQKVFKGLPIQQKTRRATNHKLSQSRSWNVLSHFVPSEQSKVGLCKLTDL